MNAPRNLYVKSYGCQMNVYDSRRMADTLAPEGFAETAQIEDADLVILNTCHIREKAADKVYSELGRVRQMKDEAARAGRRVTVVLAGCVAQAEGQDILKRERAVDLVVGPQSYHRLPSLLARAQNGERPIDTDFSLDDKFDALRAPSRAATRARGISAFVTVQEGCDKFCTFCVVPYTRGAEISRPVEKIAAETQRLVDDGVREITLIGQNVNAYHGEGPDGRSWPLGRLLERLARIPEIARLRYTTSHPCDVDDSLIEAHRDLPKLMPHLHLPVQSGSDKILEAMNRRHTRADYLRTIDRLLAAQPRLAFSSDFIVGFPGESDVDFDATLSLVEDVRFASAYTFKYSPRPGTPAAELPDQVSEEIKSARLSLLEHCIEHHLRAFNTASIGKTLSVLFEKKGRYDGQVVGRTPYLQPVAVTAPTSLIGSEEQVKMTGITSYSLQGELASSTIAASRGVHELAEASSVA